MPVNPLALESPLLEEFLWVSGLPFQPVFGLARGNQTMAAVLLEFQREVRSRFGLAQGSPMMAAVRWEPEARFLQVVGLAPGSPMMAVVQLELETQYQVEAGSARVSLLAPGPLRVPPGWQKKLIEPILKCSPGGKPPANSCSAKLQGFDWQQLSVEFLMGFPWLFLQKK